MTFIYRRERESKQYPVMISAVQRFRYSVVSMDTDDRTSGSWFSAVSWVVSTQFLKLYIQAILL